MTYDEAIEKMAEGMAKTDCGAFSFTRCGKVPGDCDCRLSARRAAEAIGLREMMEALERAREADSVRRQHQTSQMYSRMIGSKP